MTSCVKFHKILIKLIIILTLVLSTSLATAQDKLPTTAYGAPSQAQLDAFFGAKEDPPAKELLGVNDDYAGRSYLAGDEWNLHLYYPHIKNIKGGYIGVGSDQGYLLMSWARPEFAWLTDYDPLVVVTHKVYRAFFLEAKTPQEFYDLWKKKNQAKGLEILEKHWKDDEHYGQIKRIYKDVGPKIYRRHRRIKKILKQEKVPSYLNDQEHYDYIRGMVATKRVRPMLGNLLDDEALVSIGQAATTMNIPIRIFYLSNAQEYWKYPQQFRDNVAALPFDDQSFVLHTLSTWSTNKDYRYVLQPALNFAEWMKESWLLKVYHMIPRRKLEGAEDIDFIKFNGDVAKARARHEKRKKRKKSKSKQ